MPDAKPPEPPEGTAAPFSSPEEVATAWQMFRDGQLAPCPVDGAPLALAVDGSANVYRLVCTKCGTASGWFEAGADGVQLRGPRATGPGATD